MANDTTTFVGKRLMRVQYGYHKNYLYRLELYNTYTCTCSDNSSLAPPPIIVSRVIAPKRMDHVEIFEPF